MANAVLDPKTGKSMDCRDLIKSPTTKTLGTHYFATVLGQLAQGVGNRFHGTNTIHLFPKDAIPHNRRKNVTYGRIVVDVNPQNAEPERN
jgi:hypothetical protein